MLIFVIYPAVQIVCTRMTDFTFDLSYNVSCVTNIHANFCGL